MKILCVDAHPDDSNISCGGTIARFVREGHEVTSVYFAPCTEAKENAGHLEDHKRACEILGIIQVLPFNYARDRLEEHKQDIRNQLWAIRNKVKPDLILCPSIKEWHQDHLVVGECSETIFRDSSSILHYEVLRSTTPDFNPNFYVILSEEDIKKKMDAISCYKSQLDSRAYFFSKEIFKSHMIMRGIQIKTKYAECFESRIRL